MRPKITFEGVDPELHRLGMSVVRFLEEVSEAHPEDVRAMLAALKSWHGPDSPTLADIATLNGTVQALELRIEHGPNGLSLREELLRLDVTGMVGN
jgi:hypothetical protein